MTGEPDPMKKDTLENCIKRLEEVEMEKRATKHGDKIDGHEIPSPIMYSGTSISEGDGKMLTIVVGDASAIGLIRKTLQADD